MMANCVQCGRGVPDAEPEELCVCEECQREYVDPSTRLTADERIDTIRTIANRWQWGYVDGTILDSTSARVIISVYDRLAPENQVKYRNYSAPRMATIAWKLLEAR